MTLAAGTKLGAYEVVTAIGAGGMGEVYEANDSRLKRRVAIKIIGKSIAADHEAISLFEREAQTLAALSHPNIAQIYGVQETPSGFGIVMELVSGIDLAQHLRAKGALARDEALAIARQICDGLEAAHERGIIHRDLKPANIKLTPDGVVKIIDFGLAKATAVGGDVSNSPTLLTIDGTGAVIGTAPYMSPEQAKARLVDSRTDIWAFGCVLFEMLSDRRAFEGDSATEILASIIKTEPDWSRLPKDIPPKLERVIRRCLLKDPKKRIRHIGDVRLELDELESQVDLPVAASAAFNTRTWAALVCAGLLIAALTYGLTRPTRHSAPLRRFDISVPELAAGFGSYAALDPTGSRIAYASQSKMWVRELSDTVPRAVTGTDHPNGPMWSPDGQMLAYSANKKLWKVSVSGGAPVQICDIPGTGDSFGGDWGRDDMIRFPVWRGSVYAVPAAGGTPEVVMAVDPKTEIDVHSVRMLPDGKSFVYFLHTLKESDSSIGVFADGQRHPINVKGTDPIYASSGHLFYTVEQETSMSVWEVPFSLRGWKVTGTPQLVAEDAGAPQVASDGTLLYINAPPARSNLAWIDRKGESLKKLEISHEYQSQPSISPDGNRVAYTASDSMNPYDIWVMNLSTNAINRLTFGGRTERIERELPMWSPRGDLILYSELRNVHSTLVSIPSDGSGSITRVADGVMGGYSPNGNIVAVSTVDQAGNSQVNVVWLDGTNRSKTIIQGGATTGYISISPDGRFIAYNSDESGHNEIYVKSFPSGEGKWQVSTVGGTRPEWSADGKELFFINENSLFSVPVKLTPSFTFGSAEKLFTAASVDLREGYAASKDGQRFIVVVKKEREAGGKLVITENWQPEKK